MWKWLGKINKHLVVAIPMMLERRCLWGKK